MATYKTKADLVADLKAAGLEQTSTGNWYKPGRYELSYGEYERPDYIPRRYRDGWALHAVYYYYRGTFRARTDGRMDSEAQAWLLVPAEWAAA